MVNLLFIDDADVLTKPGIVKALCDPVLMSSFPKSRVQAAGTDWFSSSASAGLPG
jgi:hypothetical protein